MAQRSIDLDLGELRRSERETGVVIPFPSRGGRLRVIGRVASNVVLGIVAALALAVAVVSVGPRFLPYQVLPVLTGSMEPAIPTGSVAVMIPVRAEELAVGDVITFHHPNDPRSYVTHRIAAIEDDAGTRTLVTKGDANALPDAWRVVASGGGWRYAFAIPQVGRALLEFESSALRYLAFALPLLALAAVSLVEIWRPRPRLAQPAARTA